jgi:hypothetical protein
MKKLLRILIILGCTQFSFGEITSDQIDENAFVQKMEKFYQDLASKNIDAITPLILRHKSVSLEQMVMVGDALERGCLSPVGMNNLNRIAEIKNLDVSFKEMTGVDLISYRLYILRYSDSERLKAMGKEIKVGSISKFQYFEDVHCDIWLCGSDGKWLVACDVSPAFPLNRQSLGFTFLNDKSEADRIQKHYKEMRKASDDSLIGSPK